MEEVRPAAVAWWPGSEISHCTFPSRGLKLSSGLKAQLGGGEPTTRVDGTGVKRLIGPFASCGPSPESGRGRGGQVPL